MIRRTGLLGVCILVLVTPSLALAQGHLDLDPNVTSGTLAINGGLIDFHKLGGNLSGSCDYDWWYGCTPTSAGMLAGYYDRNGYGGVDYSNLVPGGVAELETYAGPPTGSSASANNAIASAGHIADFWTGYGNSGDDPLGSGRAIPGGFDCLADFMGTSQDSCGNSDGSTTIYNWTDGAKFYYSDAVAISVTDQSGMYGIYEYIGYAGYSADIVTVYNQYIVEQGKTYGFSLNDYIAQIDAGRPVLIHIENHTMCGIGYNDSAPNTIYVYDTWTAGPHSMTWGGSYSGAEHWGVTVVELVPEPMTVILLLLGFLGVVRRRRAA